MESNEQKSKEQHSTGKHPEPSDNVQSDIETVTPDTENGGLEDINKHESKDKAGNEPEQDEAGSGASGSEQQVNEDDSEQQNTEQDETDQQVSEPDEAGQSGSDELADGDERGDVETVSP